MREHPFYKLEAADGKIMVKSQAEVFALLNDGHENNPDWDTYDENSTQQEIEEGINTLTSYTFIKTV